MESLKSLLLSGAIGLWLFWLWTRKDLYRFALKFPGKIGLPLFGSLHRIKSWENFIPALGQIMRDCKQRTICIWLGTHPVILTADPKFIEQVLSSTELLNKAKILYTPLYEVLEGGLLTSAVKEWQPHRKLINPAFNHKVLLTFLPIFNKAKRVTITKLTALADDNEHQLSAVIKQVTLNNSLETIMGKQMKIGEELNEDLAPKFSYMMKNVAHHTALSFLHMKWLFILHRKFYATRDYIENFVTALINEKLNNKSEVTNEYNNNNNASEKEQNVLEMKKTPKLFLDQAIKLYENKYFSWHDMLSESVIMLISSFETSSNAILSTLIMLAMHPTVQQRLYEEIVNIFPDEDFEMTYEHLNQLPYLEMVINETLRLAPSAPLIGRQVVHDTQLNNDLLLPQGLQILISIYDLHRRQDIWGVDAHKFNPDNFLPENLQNKHAYAYMPFSKGLRNCIGWRYALFSIQIMIVGLVRNFRFTTTFKYTDIEFVNYIAMRYKVEPALMVHLRH